MRAHWWNWEEPVPAMGTLIRSEFGVTLTFLLWPSAHLLSFCVSSTPRKHPGSRPPSQQQTRGTFRSDLFQDLLEVARWFRSQLFWAGWLWSSYINSLRLGTWFLWWVDNGIIIHQLTQNIAWLLSFISTTRCWRESGDEERSSSCFHWIAHFSMNTIKDVMTIEWDK